MKKLFWYITILTCFPIGLSAINDYPSAESPEMKEVTVKALFVYNFTKYIWWESNEEENFVIGVYGDSEITEELMLNCKNKTANNKPIEVKAIKNIYEIKTCAMLYIPQKHNDSFNLLKTEALKNKVVIITESNGMCSKGSCLNIIRKEKKLGFEINATELKQWGIKFYEQLTSLATSVY